MVISRKEVTIGLAVIFILVNQPSIANVRKNSFQVSFNFERLPS